MKLFAMGLAFGMMIATAAIADQPDGRAACLFYVTQRITTAHGVELLRASVTAVPNRSAFTTDYRVDLTMSVLKHRADFSWMCKYRYGIVDRVFRVCRPDPKFPRTSARNLSCLAPSAWR